MMKKIKYLLFFGEFINKEFQKGQALLIVVMVMVIALTVGLSILVRTTSSVHTSNEDENSQRAFSAAEAGVEQSLVSGSAVPLTTLAGSTSYQTAIATVGGPAFNLSNGTIVLKDDPVDIWLSTYPTYAGPWNGNLTINWGSASDVCNPSEAVNTQAAIELILIYGTKVNPSVKKYALDPCASRRSVNNFQSPTVPGDSINGKTYAYKKVLPIASGLIMRIVPLYAPTVIGAEGDVGLPSQGSLVTATGVSDNAQRKIVSYRGNPKLPIELFPFNIFVQK